MRSSSTLLVAAALMAAATMPAAAGKTPAWCAQYDAYTYNCGFFTFAQCLATISGAGGYCRPNYWAQEPVRSYKPKRAY
jgi:hypothetical protein